MKKIIILSFVILAIFLLSLGIRDLTYSIQSNHWKTTEGTIINKNIKKIRTKSTNYKVNLNYEYFVEAEVYRSSRIFWGYNDSWFESNAEKIIKEYPDKKVLVYYKRANPKISVLEPGIHLESFYYIFLSCFILICIFYELKIKV